MVLAIFAAFASGVAAEVKHVPYMGGPDILAGKELTDQFLMIISLVFFGIVALLGIGGVPVQCLTAVFRAANGGIGIFFMEFVKPGAVHGGFSAIPSKVVVVGDNIRNVDVFLVHGAVGKNRHGGQPGLVQLVAQVVQDAVIFQKIGIRRALHGDLVAEAPDDDRGMVVILNDQLRHLADGIVPSSGHMVGDIGDLSPDDHTPLITEVIEVLIVLVVGQPDGGCANLADQVHVLPVVLGKQRVSDLPAVLVPGNAPQGIFLPVENEAPLGINGEGAAAEPGGNLIQNRAILKQLRLAGVQVGILPAVPQVDVFDAEVGVPAALIGSDNLSVGTQQAVADGLTGLVVGHENPDLHTGIRSFHRRGDLNAGAAVIIQIKMGIGNADQVHVPVKSAIEGKVRYLGIHPAIGGVVHQNGQQVVVFQGPGHIHPPGGVAAVMMLQMFSVQKHIGR